MARLECRFSASPARIEVDDYVREVRVDVFEFDEAINNEYLIGRLLMDQVLWKAAEIDRMSLFDICDNDSQGLHEVHGILTSADGGLRSDLDIDGPVDHLLFIHRFVLHPDFARYRRAVLDAAVTLFGWESLVVMWLAEGDFTERELGDLGFRKISGEQLVFRHLPMRTAYGDRFPLGEAIEESATPEHNTWVIAQTEPPAASRV